MTFEGTAVEFMALNQEVMGWNLFAVLTIIRYVPQKFTTILLFLKRGCSGKQLVVKQALKG